MLTARSLPAMAVVALMVLGGCARMESVVMPSSGPAIDNPTTGVAVRLDKVVDLRRFENNPPRPDIPSLSQGSISDTALTSRTIGRKRGGFGMAFANFKLPEGQTVARLVGASITQGFQHAGYRVLKPGDPGYDQAIPISADVQEFWTWMNPGFTAITVTNRSVIFLKGPLPALSGGKTVTSEVSDKTMAAFEDVWVQVMNNGLADLVTKIRAILTQ